jgi:glycosyltransferase involved in cell wall biosynthesis
VNKTSNAPIAILSAKKEKIPCVWHVRSFAKRLGLVAKYFVRSCSRILFVSEAAKSPYEKAFPEFKEKFRVLYNRINFKDETIEKGRLRKELALSRETPLVGMIAHLTPWKKHDDFLICAYEILKVMPEIRFVIVGGTLDSNPQEEKSKKDYKSKLNSIFSKYGLAGKVFFLGQRYDIKNIYSDLDVLVIPSQFESFGRVSVEGALNKVPLVAYKGGGLPEIFLEGEEILFAAPGDVQGLSQKIMFLLNHSLEKMNQAKKAYEKALLFTSDRSIRMLEETYRELLNGVDS